MRFPKLPDTFVELFVNTRQLRGEDHPVGALRSKTETTGRLSAGDPVKIDHAAPNVRFGQPLELPSQGRLRCRMANGFVGNKVVTSKRLSYTGVHRDRRSEPDY